MDTQKFKTRSEINERKMPRINGNNQYKGKTVIALDGGYSSVKGAGPLRVFTYPSYAKKAPIDLEVVGKLQPNDILLKDKTTNQTWLVGRAAETLMDQSDLDSTTDASLYTRYRYDSDMFRIIMTAGLAIGLWGTTEGAELYLQTGLPSTYKDRDTDKLISVLQGNYDISIKIGQSAWTDFKFYLPKENIFVMEQPQGTLCSVALKEDIESTKYGDIMSSNTLILDVGFGTEDLFSIRSGFKNSHQTYSDTAMKAVFEEVIKEMKRNYPDCPDDFKIFEFQNYLETGKASYFDPTEFKMNYIDFSSILERVNQELCEKSIMRLMQDYQNLKNYKYLVVTGGTGESRFDYIKQKLSAISTLTVLPGNINNSDLPYIYSNVMGYYIFRHKSVAKAFAKEQNQVQAQ